MNPTAIYSKTGKGMNEAGGKTSHLARADRAVLAAIDGRTTVHELNLKFDKIPEAKFIALIEQMDKDGFIREASPGVAPVQAKAPAKPAAGAPKGKAPAAAPGEELDFTAVSAARPAAPPPPQIDLAAKARADAERKTKEEEAISYKSRAEAEAKAKVEAEARARAEREARARAEADAKARAEADAKEKAESDARLRAEADAKVKAARDAAVRLAAGAKAKAEAEANARVDVERKAREEVERRAKEETERARKEAEERTREVEAKARREAEELRRQLEDERKQIEEERKRREDEDLKRREEEERARKEAEERRKREEDERRKKEEEERARRRREEEEEEKEKRARKRREEEEEEKEKSARKRREKDEEEKEKSARKRREEEEKEEEKEKRARKRREEEEEEEKRARKRREEEAERKPAEVEAKPAAAASSGDKFADSLLADLDSFSNRDEEERKAKEEADRKAKEDAARRAREEEERNVREEAARREKEEGERRRRAEEERRAREEEERRAQEEVERKEREVDERKRKAKEALEAKLAEQETAGGGDIGVSDTDLDMDDVRRDERALSIETRRAAREREREARRAKEAPAGAAAAPAKPRKPVKWGKPAAIGAVVLLVAAVGVVHVMPVSTADYEKAASEALGQPVKIASARLSLFTGVQIGFERVSVGAMTIAAVRAYPEVGSLFSEKKAFSRIELEGASIPQQALGDALLGAFRGENLKVGRVIAKQLKLEGPVKLPPLEADASIAGDGTVRAVSLRGPENLLGRLAPKGGEIEFELTAGSFALPLAPEVSLSQFGMKGTATRDGMRITSWDGTTLDGIFKGSANLSWGPAWKAQGELRVTGLNPAVFAPALLSEGKAEANGRFTLGGADPSKLGAAGRFEGSFTIAKGVLGSFDLSRAIQTQGNQASGRTQFAELTGQGAYDNGAVSLKNLTLSAGALNAGASLDIAPSGALSGRIVADVKTQAQTLRATLSIAGTVKEPQVRK